MKEKPVINFRPYQREVFFDDSSGILMLHWSRQIGKSFVLAHWAVNRCLSKPGRLITVLSNSKANGGEFMVKCHEACAAFKAEAELLGMDAGETFDNMRMELRIKRKGKVSRIIVLAANPRTARGFSGDLILDEFAFHENSAAIWEAAEPILSSNQDFLCRIASTGNGKHNMFYRMCSDPAIKLSRIPRSLAFKQGVKVFDPTTRQPITPDQARSKALDKRAYDQNYECAFMDENMTLLSHELISAAERDGVGEICQRDWTGSALARLREAVGSLYVGYDIGRKVDLSVITVAEKLGGIYFIRAILRIQDMRLPDQQLRLGEICRMPKFRRAALDMTGLGLGLFEYAQKEYGASRIFGINFASTVPTTKKILEEGRKQTTVRVTEAMATELLQVYEDRRIQHPADGQLRDDLRKPEKITSPGGRVSIAATRDEAGHADHFWSLALVIEAGSTAGGPFSYSPVKMKGKSEARIGGVRQKGVLV